jgi:hypothetical protein
MPGCDTAVRINLRRGLGAPRVRATSDPNRGAYRWATETYGGAAAARRRPGAADDWAGRVGRGSVGEPGASSDVDSR